MIRYLLFLVLLFSSLVPAQNKHKTEIDSVSGKPMIVGVYSREILSDSVWDQAYQHYEVDAITADELIAYTADIKIKIIAATWCSDSREVVPAFYKLLDYITFPEKDVQIIFVNRAKKSLGDEVTKLGIEFVPTIIFYRNNKELGRIIERPYDSLEGDMLSILAEQTE